VESANEIAILGQTFVSMRPIRRKGEARRNCGQRGGAAGAVAQDLGSLAGLTNAATHFHHGRRAAAASLRL
jgi:hypothetical protein